MHFTDEILEEDSKEQDSQGSSISDNIRNKSRISKGISMNKMSELSLSNLKAQPNKNYSNISAFGKHSSMTNANINDNRNRKYHKSQKE